VTGVQTCALPISADPDQVDDDTDISVEELEELY